MVDAAPGMPGDAGTFPGYRGDPWSRVFRFVGFDTTDWDCDAQGRRYPDSGEIIATYEIETAFNDDIELVRVSLDEDAMRALPKGDLPSDLEVRADDIDPSPRTMLKWIIDVDPDVTRVEVGS